MSTDKQQPIWMILGSTSKINDVAPGMVMFDLQAYSRYAITLVGAMRSDDGSRSPENLIAVRGSVLTRMLRLIVSCLPYRLKKNLFMTSHWGTIAFYFRAMQLVYIKKPAVVVVHVGYALCWLLKWIAPGTKIVYYHHGGNMHIKLSATHWNRLVKSCPQLIIAVSEAAVRGCRETFDHFPLMIKAIHNGVHTQTLSVKNEYNKREIFGIPDPFVFCYAGRMNLSKGIDILLDAFSEISLKYPRARLLLIGAAGSDSTETENSLLTEKIKRNNDRIVVTGKIPKGDVASFQALADIGVLLSQSPYEGNSLFAIESLHLGIPLILTNMGGNSEILEVPRPPGVLLEVDEHIRQNVFAAMQRLITDQSLMLTLRQHAIERSAYFSAARMANEFDDAISSLLHE